MLFYTNVFIAFFLIFLFVMFVAKGAGRLWVVLLASCVFYSWWYLPYFVILLGFILVSYAASFQVARMKRWQFVMTIIIFVLPLVVFKYPGFIIHNFSTIFRIPENFHVNWGLPLGISFITFTVIAYLVDVRKKIVDPERNFVRYGVFISFFPHLIAGPIMRARELLPQLDRLGFKKKYIKAGLFLFAIGMLKKIVFADQIGVFVDKVYNASAQTNALNSLLAFYGFPIQIYCDFSGYMDMAYGLAFIIGIRLPLNFNRPYLATSIRDFWRRWHISLSRWLKDYLYIPLGGGRRGFPRMLGNLMITMLLGGLWHGAAWTFVIWGGLHGFYLVVERLWQRYFPAFKISPWLSGVIVFHLVSLAWIFFRARSFEQIGQLFTGLTRPTSLGAFLEMTMFPVILIVLCLLLHRWDRVSYSFWFVRRMPGSVVISIALGLILLSKVLAIGGAGAFIYFDF